MTEITIRLLDNGGVQIGQTELAKLQEWQKQTGSSLAFTHICQSDEPDNNPLYQSMMFDE